MKLQDQVVNLDIAQNLEKLGAPQEAFWSWVKSPNNKEHSLFQCEGLGKTNLIAKGYDVVSAFSVAELGEMLPQVIKKDDDLYYIEPNVNGNGLRYMDYVKYHMGVGQFLRAYPLVDADTEADARAKMLIYLLENNLISLP